MIQVHLLVSYLTKEHSCMVKCGYSERCSGSASSTQEESQLLKVPEHSGFVSIACKKFL